MEIANANVTVPTVDMIVTVNVAVIAAIVAMMDAATAIVAAVIINMFLWIIHLHKLIKRLARRNSGMENMMFMEIN